MKMYAYVTNPEQFLSTNPWDKDMSVSCTTSEGMEEHGWVLVGEFEIDIAGIDENKVRKLALEAVEKDEKKERAEHEVKMRHLEERRQNLLCIAHVPASPEGQGQLVDDDVLPL